RSRFPNGLTQSETSQNDAHQAQAAQIISVPFQYRRAVGKEHARLWVLVEPIVLLIAQKADHLIPIFSTGVADAFANGTFLPPESPGKTLVHHNPERGTGLAILLVKTTAIE